MWLKKFLEIFDLPNGTNFWIASFLIIISFFIIKFFGPYKIIGMLSIISVTALTFEMFNKQFFKYPVAILVFISSIIVGISVFGYVFFGNIMSTS
ncbi:hypothetical protein Halha_1955 [Halobacteroides halobius DSM 5150]|uniref:Uncharacterized protein n=1 Tax=Halobacteroides halobius (strain ATCC 35273 / DSM 5150 / MD-1) TaxID=748449 RepID=L0KBE9_HALHC|nr:hypothetical protein [Halobacteroides halobius]AGB41860.1 hypothetical protein Halha_1955 [Halobacteroides halobius DSM 5150]